MEINYIYLSIVCLVYVFVYFSLYGHLPFFQCIYDQPVFDLDSKKLPSMDGVAPLQDEIPLSSYIVSAQFWPPLREEKIKLPPDMEKVIWCLECMDLG